MGPSVAVLTFYKGQLEELMKAQTRQVEPLGPMFCVVCMKGFKKPHSYTILNNGNMMRDSKRTQGLCKFAGGTVYTDIYSIIRYYIHTKSSNQDPYRPTSTLECSKGCGAIAQFRVTFKQQLGIPTSVGLFSIGAAKVKTDVCWRVLKVCQRYVTYITSISKVSWRYGEKPVEK